MNTYISNWGSVVANVTWLGAGRSEFRIPVGARNFCLVRILRPVSGAHSVSFSLDTVIFFTGVKRPGCGVDRCPHVTLRLRMSRTVPLPLLYAFVAVSQGHLIHTCIHTVYR